MNKLSLIRKNKGYSQAKLAELSEVNLGTIQKYESGERDLSKAQVQTVKKLADALCVTIDELLEETIENSEGGIRVSPLMRKLQDAARRSEMKVRKDNLIEESIQIKLDAILMKILDKPEFFSEYYEDDVIQSTYAQGIFNENYEPGTVISRDQLEYYNKYVAICDDGNQKLESLIREYYGKYFDEVSKYLLQAVNEGIQIKEE